MHINEKLHKQISDATENIYYTYVAHWCIVNRLKKQYKIIIIVQIVLTALSAGGVFTSIIKGIEWLSLLGGITSAIALALNLYLLNFNVADEISKHTAAANELWELREQYNSLLVDYNDLSSEEIRLRRNELTNKTSEINKKYPGTDDKSFKEAKEKINDYIFEDDKSSNISKQTKD